MSTPIKLYPFIDSSSSSKVEREGKRAMTRQYDLRSVVPVKQHSGADHNDPLPLHRFLGADVPAGQYGKESRSDADKVIRMKWNWNETPAQPTVHPKYGVARYSFLAVLPCTVSLLRFHGLPCKENRRGRRAAVLHETPSLAMRPVFWPLVKLAQGSLVGFWFLNMNIVQAQVIQSTDEIQLSPVVISATRTSQLSDSVLPSTSLITQQMIRDSQAVDLADLLRHEAGIEILQNGGIGTQASIQMRGANSRQVLILLDGVEIDSLSTGQAPFEQIMLNQIENIEIVRGNISALYGSKAMGGVIRISTFTSQANQAIRTAVTFGPYHSRGAHINLHKKFAETSMQLKLSRQLSESFPPLNQEQFPQTNQQDHSYHNTSIASQLTQPFNRNWVGGLRFFQSEGTTQSPPPSGSPNDVSDTYSATKILSAFLEGAINPQWNMQFILAQNQDINHNHFFNSRTIQTSTSQFDTINRKLAWQNEIVLSRNACTIVTSEQKTRHAEHSDETAHDSTARNEYRATPYLGHAVGCAEASSTLLFGYEYLTQMLTTSSYTPPARTINAFFLGYQIHLDKQQLQANIRHDRYSDFGYANSFFLGYGYAFTPSLKAYLNLSNAFRAPSFNDLYFPNYSNVSLQAEHANSLEIGLQYAQAAQRVRLSVFKTRYKNLIDYQLSDPIYGYTTPFNIGQAVTQGIETTITSQLANNTEVRASTTWQISKNQIDNTALTGRAHHFANLHMIKKWQRFQLGIALQIMGQRIDRATQHPLSGYSLFDTTLSYQPDKNWTLRTKVANVFDRPYQTIYGYNTPRRGLYITLAWQPSLPEYPK